MVEVGGFQLEAWMIAQASAFSAYHSSSEQGRGKPTSDIVREGGKSKRSWS